LITLIYHQLDLNLLNFSIQLLWNSFFNKKNYILLQLLGTVILGHQDSLCWLKEDKIDYLIRKMLSKINNYSPKKHKKLYYLLFFVTCMLQNKNERVNNFIKQYHIQIYQSLKNQQKNDLKDIETTNFQLIFKILKDLVLGDR
jgi:hypothetical protein